MNIADLVHNTRIERAIGLRELARDVGCAPTMICDLEHGRKRPGPGLAARLADRLGLEGDDRATLFAGVGRIGPRGWAAMMGRSAIIDLLRTICELAIDDRRIDTVRRNLERSERRKHARAMQGSLSENRDR